MFPSGSVSQPSVASSILSPLSISRHLSDDFTSPTLRNRDQIRGASEDSRDRTLFIQQISRASSVQPPPSLTAASLAQLDAATTAPTLNVRTLTTPTPSQVPRAPRTLFQHLPASSVTTIDEYDDMLGWTEGGLPYGPEPAQVNERPPFTVRARRRSTPAASAPQIAGQDIATGQLQYREVNLQLPHEVALLAPDQWRTNYAKFLIAENICGPCKTSRLLPSRFPVSIPAL